jgi:hypothetical protein
MNETQLLHTLHIMLNQEKPKTPVWETGLPCFSCNDYILNSGCFGFQNRMFRFLLSSSQ